MRRAGQQIGVRAESMRATRRGVRSTARSGGWRGLGRFGRVICPPPLAHLQRFAKGPTVKNVRENVTLDVEGRARMAAAARSKRMKAPSPTSTAAIITRTNPFIRLSRGCFSRSLHYDCDACHTRRAVRRRELRRSLEADHRPFSNRVMRVQRARSPNVPVCVGQRTSCHPCRSRQRTVIGASPRFND